MSAKPAMGQILVVEDDETIRDTLVQILADEGYATVGAGNGREALAWLDAQPSPPALIVLDLRMPTMNGWELYAELQKRPAVAMTPVLLVSADAHVAEKARASPGNLVALRKPFDVDVLLALVADLCAGRIRGPESAAP